MANWQVSLIIPTEYTVVVQADSMVEAEDAARLLDSSDMDYESDGEYRIIETVEVVND